MKNYFECCYISIGETYCFHKEKEISDCFNNECKSMCDMNDNCENCIWKMINKTKICERCTLKRKEINN